MAVRKIKHWQGYGYVNAEKIEEEEYYGNIRMVIKVSGEHEWGIVRRDEYDVFNWLVKKFSRKVSSWLQIYSLEVNCFDNENAYYIIKARMDTK